MSMTRVSTKTLPLHQTSLCFNDRSSHWYKKITIFPCQTYRISCSQKFPTQISQIVCHRVRGYGHLSTMLLNMFCIR